MEDLTELPRLENNALAKLQEQQFIEESIHQTELNEADHLIQQLKNEQSFMKKELYYKNKEIMEKDKMLAEARHELILKQTSFDAAVSEQSNELDELQKITVKQSEEIVTLQKEMKEKEKELLVTKNEMCNMHDKLTQQSDELSAEIACKQTMEHKLVDQQRIISTLQTYIVWCKAEKKQLAENEKEMVEKLSVKEVELAKLKEELQNCLDVLAYKENVVDMLQGDNAMYQDDLNNTKDLIQQLKKEHLQELDANQNEIMEKLKVKDEVVDELKEELILRQNSFDAAVNKHLYEMEKLQKTTQEQSDKILSLQKIVEEKEEELVVQRNEISDLHCELTQQSDLLSAGKETMKHQVVDKERIINTLQAYIVWYKAESNEAKNKIRQLNIEFLSMKEELAEMMEKCRVKNEELTELKEELIEQSDHLSAEIADKQTMKAKLADKEQMVDKLQADVAMYENELHNTKDSLSQVKIEWSFMKQELVDNEKAMRIKDEALAELRKELIIKQNCLDDIVSRHSTELEGWQKECQEQSDKMLILQKAITENKEELVVTKKQISDLNDQLAEQADLLNTEMAEKQKIQEVLTSCKEKINWRMVDKLEADKDMYRSQLIDAEDLIQQLKMEQSSTRQQLEQEVEEKGEELVITKSEISNLQHQLAHQSDLLSATITSYAEKEQTFDGMLTDKQRMINMLRSDVEMYTTKLNDIKESMQQLLTEQSSVKEKEITEKDEALAELKEQLTAKQHLLEAAEDRHSVELTKWQKQIEKQTDRILSLQQEIVEKEEELIVTRNEMSDELTQQSDLLCAEVAYTQTLKHTLDDKERIINQLKEDIATYQAETNNIKYRMSQLEEENVSMKQELTGTKKGMSVKDEAIVKLKEELNVRQNSLVDASIVKKKSIELETSQIKNEGQFEKIIIPKQQVVQQEVTNKDRVFTNIIPANSKEVSHQKCIH